MLLGVFSRIVRVSLPDDGGWFGDVPAEDVTLEPVGKPHGQFVVDELLGGDGENLCKKCQRCISYEWDATYDPTLPA